MDFPIDSQLNLRSNYNTDTVGIEFQRRRATGSDGTKDARQDDLTFLVACNSSDEVKQNGSDYTGFRGIEDYYNGELTPRKCIINNLNWLGNSMQWGSDDVDIIFRNNTKKININYPSDLEISFKNEQDKINASLSSVVKPLFYPEIIKCDFTINQTEIKTLESDMHVYVTFNSEDGVNYSCYILNLEINDFEGKGTGEFIIANTGR